MSCVPLCGSSVGRCPFHVQGYVIGAEGCWEGAMVCCLMVSQTLLVHNLGSLVYSLVVRLSLRGL